MHRLSRTAAVGMLKVPSDSCQSCSPSRADESSWNAPHPERAGSIARRSFVPERLLRFLAPSGVRDVVYTQRLLAATGVTPGRAWARAITPRYQALSEVSRLRYVPRRLLRSPRCVVDVGAHVGMWSDAVISLINPVRVVAIEPTPSSFAALQTRIGHHPGVSLVPCAVGASKGRAILQTSNASDFNSLLAIREGTREKYGHINGSGTVEVDVRPLDELLEDVEEISLLKIDVQGSESAVLDGAFRTLERTDAVLLEANFVSHYYGDTLFSELHRRMTDQHGFSLYSLVPSFYDPEGRLVWADVVYTRATA